MQTKESAIYGIFAEEGTMSQASKRHRSHTGPQKTADITFVQNKPQITEALPLSKNPPPNENNVSKSNLEFSKLMKSSKSSILGSNEEPSLKKQKIDPRSLIKKKKPVMNKQFGSWEKHTKGIGMKLLMKMGFTGRLGKYEQGTSVPVQVVVRKGRAAVGGGGFKEMKHYNKEFERELYGQESEEKKDDDGVTDEIIKNGWRRGVDMRSSRKKKKVYKTAQQLLDIDGEGIQQNTSVASQNQKIIDMTGREARVVDSFAGLSSREISIPKVSVGRELVYNISLAVKNMEGKILALGKKKRDQNAFTLHTTEEVKATKMIVADRQKRIERIKRVHALIARVVKTVHSSNINVQLSSLLNVFKSLAQEYENEYNEYHLAALAKELVPPLLSSRLKAWKPFEDQNAKLLSELLRPWHAFFTQNAINTSSSMPQSSTKVIYDYIVNTCVDPFIRNIVISWNVRNTHPCVTFFKSLSEPDNLMSRGKLETILQNVIYPKLEMAVQNWNPTTDRIAIDKWIHPWIMSRLLPPHLTKMLFPTIRQKLALALRKWDVSDTSAFILLKPWEGIFERKNMAHLLINCILPKVIDAFKSLSVSRTCHCPVLFQKVMEWRHLIPSIHFISVIEGEFFPQWLRVLHTWLSDNPNFAEIQTWYKYWKTQFPLDLMDNFHIKKKFTLALSMLSTIAKGGEIDPNIIKTENNSNYQKIISLRQAEIDASKLLQRMEVEKKKVKTLNSMTNSASGLVAKNQQSYTFKDVVAKFAADNNVSFTPNLRRKRVDGNDIYFFGKTSCYISKGVIFAHNAESEQWDPISVQDMLKIEQNEANRATQAFQDVESSKDSSQKVQQGINVASVDDID